MLGMQPHHPGPDRRRFSFGVSAGLLLLVSACSTIGPSSDSGSGTEVAAQPAPQDPEPIAGRVGGSGSRAASLPRRAAKPMAARADGTGQPSPAPVIARPAEPVTVQPAESGPSRPDASLQVPADGTGLDAVADDPPVVGPVPKLEPLARHANRPYRLRGRKYTPMTDLRPFRQRGIASWYGKPFHGRRTATGERFDMHAMSAAHPTLPLPSYLKVTNLKSGTSVIVRVNDRGPFAHDRVIDLSHAAAKHLGIVSGGIAAVELNLIVPEPAGMPLPAPLAAGAR